MIGEGSLVAFEAAFVGDDTARVVRDVCVCVCA
jgi:hypothetical protein